MAVTLKYADLVGKKSITRIGKACISFDRKILRHLWQSLAKKVPL